MANRNVTELHEELNRLTLEHTESVSAETFLGRLDEAAWLRQQERLKRIREVSADLLVALERRAA